jgi:hypothetical protein
MLKSGNLRGDVIQYLDGIGCCIWYPLIEGADEEIGICFDFSMDDLDDLIALLQEMKITEPELFEDENDA